MGGYFVHLVLIAVSVPENILCVGHAGNVKIFEHICIYVCVCLTYTYTNTYTLMV